MVPCPKEHGGHHDSDPGWAPEKVASEVLLGQTTITLHSYYVIVTKTQILNDTDPSEILTPPLE